MLKLGVTGGIGSGKSIVCKVFQELRVPVYYADLRARVLTETSSSLKQRIISLLGPESFNSQGYNRKYVANIVFSDKEKLARLNAIVHPAVNSDFEQWLITCKKFSYVVKEAALLFESGSNKKMDYTIYINAPVELRANRVIKRDGLSKSEIISRIKNQTPAGKIMPLTDRAIENDDKQLVLPHILEIHKLLMKGSISYG